MLQVPEVPPYEPSPPRKPEPRSPFDIDPFLLGRLAALDYEIGGYESDLGPSWEEWTQETDSSGLNWYEYGLKKLQHHRSRDLEPLYLCIHDCDEFPVSVRVKYEVTADNMVAMLTGDLTVIVNKSSP